MYHSRLRRAQRACHFDRYMRTVAGLDSNGLGAVAYGNVPRQQPDAAKLEIGIALARFVLAPDWLTACCALVCYPILQSEAVMMVLRDALLEARRQQNTSDAVILQSYLEVLEYVQKYGARQAIKMLLL